MSEPVVGVVIDQVASPAVSVVGSQSIPIERWNGSIYYIKKDSLEGLLDHERASLFLFIRAHGSLEKFVIDVRAAIAYMYTINKDQFYVRNPDKDSGVAKWYKPQRNCSEFVYAYRWSGQNISHNRSANINRYDLKRDIERFANFYRRNCARTPIYADIAHALRDYLTTIDEMDIKFGKIRYDEYQ